MDDFGDADGTRELIYKLKISVYGRGEMTTVSHGYCVDDFPASASPQIGDLVVNIHTTTFIKLRDLVQYDRSSHMNRRNPIFQEALFIMSRLPNLYNRPKNELNKYLFGFIHRQSKELKIVPPEIESNSIDSFVSLVDFFDYDLLIVPLSQLPP
jgi:hypothetical protein